MVDNKLVCRRNGAKMFTTTRRRGAIIDLSENVSRFSNVEASPPHITIYNDVYVHGFIIYLLGYIMATHVYAESPIFGIDRRIVYTRDCILSLPP